MNKNMKEIDDLWGNWFAGFTDGEGCFAIGKNDEENPCVRYQCQFKINLRNDDRQILNEIHNTLGIGFVNDRSASISNICNTRPGAAFRVQAIADCAELVKVFEKYPLRAKKQHDFDFWKQAVAELQKPVNCRDPLMLDYYFHKIKEIRKYEKQEELARPRIKELQLTIRF